MKYPPQTVVKSTNTTELPNIERLIFHSSPLGKDFPSLYKRGATNKRKNHSSSISIELCLKKNERITPKTI
jgi:hypothetical protein